MEIKSAKQNSTHDVITSQADELGDLITYAVPCYVPRAGYSINDVVAELGGITYLPSQTAERRAAIDERRVFACVCEEGQGKLVARS
jgi:hypothetical protein